MLALEVTHMFFRFISASIILLGTLLNFVSPTSAENTPAYPALEQLRPYANPELLSKTINDLDSKEIPVLTFKNNNLCEDVVGSFESKLKASNEAIYQRANKIAGKITACSDNCESAINSAEYCDYFAGRSLESTTLNRWDSAFFYASYLLQQAVQHNRLTEQQLQVDAEMKIHESLDLLRLGLKTLKGEMAADDLSTQEPRFTLIKKELNDLAAMIRLLSAVDVIRGDTKELNKLLVEAAETVGELNNSLYQELSRVRVSPPSVIEQWEKRILQSAARLAWAQKVFSRSAVKAKQTSKLKPSSNANGLGSYSGSGWQQTAQCFNRISLNASTAIEGLKMEIEMLESCRSFNTCPSTKQLPLNMDKFSNLLEQSYKEAYSIEQSICTN